MDAMMKKELLELLRRQHEEREAFYDRWKDVMDEVCRDTPVLFAEQKPGGMHGNSAVYN